MPHPDDGLTSQDHENREWRPSDVILIFVAIVVVFALSVLLCSGPSAGWAKGGWITGF
jgi:hypothetical protein